MMSLSRPTTKNEQEGEVGRVYQMLRAWLISCELAPGQSLSEVDLARRCSTSRTPVREACNRLAQDGWLTREHNKGYLVTPISIQDLLQLYEYRKVLECFTAEKCAQMASPDQIANLAEIISIENRAEGTAEAIAANDRFHLTMAEMTGNRWINQQLELVLDYVKRLDTLSAAKDHGWVTHHEIIEAVREHRPQAARQAMASHIDHARDRMLTLFAR